MPDGVELKVMLMVTAGELVSLVVSSVQVVVAEAVELAVVAGELSVELLELMGPAEDPTDLTVVPTVLVRESVTTDVT